MRSRRRAGGGRSWQAPITVLVLGLAVTWGAVGFLHQQAQQQDAAQFQRESEELWAALDNRLQRLHLAVAGVRDFCGRHAGEPPERLAELWRERMGFLNMKENWPGLWEVGYAAFPAGMELKVAYESNRLFLPPDTQLPVRERERIAAKPAVTGDNLYTTQHSAAIWKALQTGTPQSTGKIELGRTYLGMPREGYRLFWPVYGPDHSPTKPKVLGVCFAAVLLDHVVRHQFGDRPRGVEFHVYAGGPSPANALTGTVSRQSGVPDRVVAADARNPLRHMITPELLGQSWTVEFRNTVLFRRHLNSSQLLAMGTAGVLLSLLMGVAVRLQVGCRVKAEAAAEALAASERRVRRESRERERLVRDLHDRTIQSLLAVTSQLLRCAGSAANAGDAAPALRRELDTAAADLELAVGEVRDAILSLGPSTEAGVPFDAALADWLQRLSRGRGTVMSFAGDSPVLERLLERQREELTAIVREAVSNALRHGRAERISVTLRAEGNRAVLTIQDDGQGFDPASVPAKGTGLEHLRQRAADLGGTCLVESQPGGPTSVRVRFPLAPMPKGAVALVI